MRLMVSLCGAVYRAMTCWWAAAIMGGFETLMSDYVPLALDIYTFIPLTHQFSGSAPQVRLWPR